ncbi:hypothetical protein HBH56_162480 [Parastagonospora nodorum]|uniref:Uncharacterized protein n=1 Tax=Phaeosphaeria nodorum (strain SN15 / ATCC MYA-4574 / FGSC 10173) TaxID=321614 RepID=A0A7U2NQ68_PHANO|nr:hypothetical protein HBH56_162480 [Parastagonospora nodorum]QRD06420.1 hypothetical protein JI435_445880 [Parastagonospora nodorum SN15]KAH3931721.1 hypothetical protein HBH54_086760 [Parastagonospora nodorum]KAH3969013.1 hypothetical protein HBH52_175830 [Parastagonospora nodorum]KAH3993901.1 hypothetical protein HBI10_196290 [Parastagonospora nodorum]
MAEALRRRWLTTTDCRFGPWQLSPELTDDHAYPLPKLDREAAQATPWETNTRLKRKQQRAHACDCAYLPDGEHHLGVATLHGFQKPSERPNGEPTAAALVPN